MRSASVRRSEETLITTQDPVDALIDLPLILAARGDQYQRDSPQISRPKITRYCI